MIPFNLPTLMVVVFALLTLVVAFYFTKPSTTFREYAVGDKQFPTSYLVATLLATTYGGGAVIRSVDLVHSWGLCGMLSMLLVSFLMFWVVSRLALRMAPFMQHLSMSETIGHTYGRYPRLIASLTFMGSSIFTIVVQINVISLAISMCVESVKPSLLTPFAILILILYASIGGIRAVMVTDIMQLFTFCTIFPLFAWWLSVKTGKPLPEIISFVQTQEKFQLKSICYTNTNLGAMIVLFLAFLMSCITPPVMQKVYKSEDHFQASRVFLNAGMASVFMAFFILLMGLFTFAIAPEVPVIETWRSVLATSPPLFKGFVIISLLAVAMSTADSFLNSCSVMFSHDIIEIIMGKQAIPYKHQLRLAKFAACFIGIIAILCSYYCDDLVTLLECRYDWYIPIVTAPFILAVWGFRTSSRTALIGMATGGLSILSWNIWIKPIIEINGSFICMLINGLAMFATHYLLPKPKHTR